MALAAAGVLAGCGGHAGPRLARADAAPLIALTDRIAHEGRCAQARDIRELDRLRLELVQSRRVPAALLEQFSAGVNALTEQTPTCLPAVAADRPSPPPPPPPTGDEGEQHGHDHKEKHGHGHGHGEGGD